jgi:hypothetical protein
VKTTTNTHLTAHARARQKAKAIETVRLQGWRLSEQDRLRESAQEGDDNKSALKNLKKA